VRFSRCGEPLIERHQFWIPEHGGRQRCRVQALAKSCTTARNVTLSFTLSTGVIEWGQPGKGGGLLSRDAADLGHARQDSQCSWQAHTIHAQDEIEPLGQDGRHPPAKESTMVAGRINSCA